MSNFDFYADYYNLLYKDKPYLEETAYVLEILKRHGMTGSHLIDFGCGTGRHAVELARKGYTVHGVDRSGRMLNMAEKLRAKNPEVWSQLSFENQDIRSFDSNTRFAAALALFHVISYQISNADVLSSFDSVRRSLNDGGLFLFDFWYGPGVLSDPPYNRTKELNNSVLSIRREARPRMSYDHCSVSIDFEISLNYLNSKKPELIRETHVMRYFFLPELELMLNQSGLELIDAYEWMSRDKLTTNVWYGCCVAKVP